MVRAIVIKDKTIDILSNHLDQFLILFYQPHILNFIKSTENYYFKNLTLIYKI